MNKRTRGVFVGFDIMPREFILATFDQSCAQIGFQMRRIRRALHDGDRAYLESLPYVRRLYRGTARREAVSAAVRDRILARDGAVCRHCGATEDLQIDHVIPVVWGGTNAPDNLQVLCRTCNRIKGPLPHHPRPAGVA